MGRRPADRADRLRVVQPEYRGAQPGSGPLTAEALSWIATLSRDDLDALGRTADRLEDVTLALAVVREDRRREGVCDCGSGARCVEAGCCRVCGLADAAGAL